MAQYERFHGIFMRQFPSVKCKFNLPESSREEIASARKMGNLPQDFSIRYLTAEGKDAASPQSDESSDEEATLSEMGDETSDSSMDDPTGVKKGAADSDEDEWDEDLILL